MSPETSLAQAEQDRADEEAKRPQADSAKKRFDRLEQEDRLAYLFRQAFSGR